MDKKNKEDIEGKSKNPVEEKIREKLGAAQGRLSKRLSFDRIKSFNNYMTHNNVESILGRKNNLFKKSKLLRAKGSTSIKSDKIAVVFNKTLKE